ncbi:elongation of very long chain fatty acids protein 6 isoform X2 [Tetranychus urticae]|uniref:elongation of very long chain fatty acids protein 6 isoform X2 n=1 Tax=Tetranychus urticae TaxID=32264 RepID=UPI00077BC955|nr:elongation of very long chain fatty acids protein 6 isoform X2 [Tetranychus urticae]
MTHCTEPIMTSGVNILLPTETVGSKWTNSSINPKSLQSWFSPSQWDQKAWVEWHQQNWSICFWFATFYVLAVRLGLIYMNNRKPYDLRYPLAIWSGLLGAFSIAGSYYMVPEIISTLYKDGFHSAACDNSYKSDKNVLFWSWLFVWSKVFEFGDTAFIILRKQKLSFLHWYHHAMTVICVFTYFPGMVAINRWTGSMNFFVHSLMYSYYALRAMRVRIPKPIAVSITTLQIAQMMIGFYVASYALVMKMSDQPCKITPGESLFSFSIYFSYFILFCNFFIQSYFKKPSPSSSRTKKD